MNGVPNSEDNPDSSKSLGLPSSASAVEEGEKMKANQGALPVAAAG